MTGSGIYVRKADAAALPRDIAGLAERLVARLTSARPVGEWPRVLFIDGRSGSGKTTLAVALAEVLARARLPRPQLVGMDELYPGWDGLAAGSARVPEMLRTGSYRRYDWHARAFTAPVDLDTSGPVIVEGCGAVSQAARTAARALGPSYALWIECPETLRRDRALARDGDMFAPHWQSWAAQELAHFARSQPIALANEIVHVGR